MYFWGGILSVAAITQILAFFEIANAINLYVWVYGVEAIG